MFDKEYHEAKARMINRAIAADVLYGLSIAGWWVKDLEFKFLDISEVASDILYGLKSNECIGKTDFEIAKELGLEFGEKQFAEVCRASDIYTIEHPKGDNHFSYTFVELLKDTKGNPHIWQTVKGLHPSKVGNEKYYYGFARFMDNIIGYDNALTWFEKEKPQLTKLNNNLYLYKNYG